MNKFKEIRPIVLGLAVKNQTFYRCLGGGIEFLEKSEVALKREFLEEINKNITIKDFLGISESIFTYEGKRAHELILFYSIELSNEDFQEEYKFIDNNRSYTAKWVDIKDFKDNKKILYPEEVLKYI